MTVPFLSTSIDKDAGRLRGLEIQGTKRKATIADRFS